MKNLFTISLLICTIFALCQERYLIEYNYLKGTKSYFKLGAAENITDTLKSPKFKKNSYIQLKITNVNPFAISVDTRVSEESIHPSQGSFTIGNLINLSIGDSSSEYDLDDLSEVIRSRGPSSEFIDNALFIKAIREAFEYDVRNPRLTKKEIIERLKERLLKLSKENSYFDFGTGDMNAEFPGVLLYIRTESEKIEREINEKYKNDSISANSRGNQLELELNDFVEETLTDVEEIQSIYNTVEGALFEFSFGDYELTSDKLTYEIEFHVFENLRLNDDVETFDSENYTKTIIHVDAKGGIKINTSLALTFNNFSTNSKSHFIDDSGIVGADENNHFIPNLSTMINFYPLLSKNYNLGLSFGISVPINTEQSGVNFLMGPSIILGNKSRIALSGGIAYGPVEKLVRGLEIGQETFENDITPFVENVYDVGYYLGFSFSLFDVND